MSDAGRSPSPTKHQKRAATSRAKGAVRAKSGCYTCRIRRKKCDERPDREGNCETCVRLRLQCLGFGAKRPDWMRENNSVGELRDRIKAFLASQGMIKGHSGSGPRCAESDPPVLVLSADPGSSTPSPPARTLSTPSNDGDHPPGLVTSHVRQAPPQHYTPISGEPNYTRNVLNHHQTPQFQMSPDSSPYVRSGPLNNPDLMLPIYAPPPSHQLLSHSTIDSVNSSSSTWPPATYSLQPVVSSRPFSGLYDYTGDDDDPMSFDCALVEAPSAPLLPLMISSSVHDKYQKHYMENVVGIQYILADRSVDSFIWRLSQQHKSARDAMCLLASVHRNCMRQRNPRAQDYDSETHTYLQETQLALQRVGASPTDGDAMAGLHAVSSFLFGGGRGNWSFFLDVACRWVRTTLAARAHEGVRAVLRGCTESTRFLMRTTMWFDVLASVTLGRSPQFLREYRELFGRGRAFIEGGGGGGGGGGSAPPVFSMLNVMGCENATLLAIAETSALAEWKDVEARRGRLSAPELVRRGLEIEDWYLQSAPYGGYHDVEVEHDLGAGGSGGGGDASLEACRMLTADVFRAAARVYLHSVLSGDQPRCAEIREGVRETIMALERVPPETPKLARSVVRSVVFPICICGCLTDEPEERAFLLQKLREQQLESVGNCSEVQRVMETVWERRDGGKAVSWRGVVKESGEDVLLLV